jgi:hypothetical protein
VALSPDRRERLEVFIVDAVRSPTGRAAKGSLIDVRADHLLPGLPIDLPASAITGLCASFRGAALK